METQRISDFLYSVIPSRHQNIIEFLKPYLDKLQEIRLRVNKPIMAYTDKELFFNEKGICSSFERAAAFDMGDCVDFMDKITQHSVYAMENQIRRGYITVRGGFRIGICGQTKLVGGNIDMITSSASFNIRISHEIIGCARPIMPYVCADANVTHNTLIISPPQMGKTTVIRDLSRCLSDGDGCARGYKVGIVDERSEIAGCHFGVPQNDVGIRTDVLDGCHKAEGIMMLLRAMSPEVIVMDELGHREDMDALYEAINCGVGVIATAHGVDLHDVTSRPVLQNIIESGAFNCYVVLGSSLGVGTFERVYNAKFEQMNKSPFRGAV